MAHRGGGCRSPGHGEEEEGHRFHCDGVNTLLREKAQKSQTKAMIKQLLKDKAMIRIKIADEGNDPLTEIRITTLYNRQADMEVSDGELETTGSRTRCLGGDSGRRRWIC